MVKWEEGRGGEGKGNRKEGTKIDRGKRHA